jgi:type VI protein secretion system component Hcp
VGLVAKRKHMRFFRFVTALLVLFSIMLLAQTESPHRPPPPLHSAPGSTTTVSISGLTCAAPSNALKAHDWSMGGSNSGFGGGKPSFLDLSIDRDFDRCTPVLFGWGAMGNRILTLALTETDNEGQAVASVQLKDVYVDQWSVSGQLSANPVESVRFRFTSVTITDLRSGATFCWNTGTNSAC